MQVDLQFGPQAVELDKAFSSLLMVDRVGDRFLD
jgi:hypothetical protein